MRDKLIELVNDVLNYLPCGQISPHTAQELADHLIDNGVTIQKWIPVAEGMPPERESVVRGLGTVSKPVLVTWVDPTSDKPFPDDRFVREGISRNGEFTISHINGDLVPIAWMSLPEPTKGE